MVDSKEAVNPNSATVPTSSLRLPGFIFFGLCAVIIFAPLPLASARPLAWDLLAIAIALLLTATLFLPMRESSIARERLTMPAVLFAIVVAVALLQTVPWLPSGLVSPIWDQAADALASRMHASIAIDRYAAWTHVLRILSYAGIFYLAVVTGRDALRAQLAVGVVALSGCMYAVYGLLVYWSGNRTILWYPKWAYLHDVTGTFVNRNSFATYLGLCTICAFFLLLQSLTRIKLHGDWRSKLSAAIEFASARVGKLIMLFILVTALFLTHSRGGLLATLSGLVGLMVMIAVAPSLGRLRRIGAWGAVPFVMFLIALFISGGGTFDRLMSVDFNTEQRFAVYRLIVQAIQDYPIRGIGFGSFADIFPIYRTEALSDYFYDLAHNDYLQNILELGIPIAFCLFAAVGWLIVICMRGIRTRQRDAIYPCLAVAASVLVTLHATVDFSLQIPAVTVTYMFLLGIGVAQSHSSRVNNVKTPNGVA
jgi:O-antigen ligase